MIGVYVHQIWLSLTIIRISGDIEENPGPKGNSNQSFSTCHWNLNSITAHNHLKISLLRAYISLHNFDVVCISETYLDPTTALAGYNLLRTDHPSNSKRGGVCVYYKNSLALKFWSVGNYVISFLYTDHQVNPQIPLKNLQLICNSH